MFGTYRTLLSFGVVASHIAIAPNVGQFAVHGFFVISGFLMTLVMQGTYGYSGYGRAAFAASRALRLYPMYLVVLATTVLSIVILGADRVAAFKDSMRLPQDLGGTIENLKMIYARWVPMSAPIRLVPPSWALTVELLFYALICLGLSRSRTLTAGWLAFSVAAALVTLALRGDDFASRYSSLLAGSLPFALGATIYHWRDELGRRVASMATIGIATTAFCAFPVMAVASWWLRNVGLEPLSIALVYLNIPLHGLIVLLLFNLKVPSAWKLLDKRIGDYSYPVYLTHYLVGLWVTVAIVEPLSPGRHAGLLLCFALTLPLSLLVSSLLLRWVDAPVERWRARIKANGAASKGRRFGDIDLAGVRPSRPAPNPSA